MFQIKKGKIKKPHFIIVYGIDGVGKTTFAADAPKPIFIDVEEGTNFLDVARFPVPNNFSEVLQMIDQVEKEEYETLVIDSLDRLEKLVFDEVCKKTGKASINDIGYAKGFEYALDYWRELIEKLKVLRNTKNVILVSHDYVKTFNDPQQMVDYDRHMMRIHHKAASLWREEVDAVLFATTKTFVQKQDGASKGKGVGGEVRVLKTERRAGFDAKNRLGLPFEIELKWEAFEMEATKGDPESCGVLYSQLCGLIPEIKDEDTQKRVKELVMQDKENPVKLRQYLNRVNQIIGEEQDA